MTAVSAPSSLVMRLKKPNDLKLKSLCRHQSVQKIQQKKKSSKTALTATVGLVRLLREDGKHMDLIYWHKSGDISIAAENAIIKSWEIQKKIVF